MTPATAAVGWFGSDGLQIVDSSRVMVRACARQDPCRPKPKPKPKPRYWHWHWHWHWLCRRWANRRPGKAFKQASRSLALTMGTKKPPQGWFRCFSLLKLSRVGGADGARTRDPRRDRPVFYPTELPLLLSTAFNQPLKSSLYPAFFGCQPVVQKKAAAR